MKKNNKFQVAPGYGLQLWLPECTIRWFNVDDEPTTWGQGDDDKLIVGHLISNEDELGEFMRTLEMMFYLEKGHNLYTKITRYSERRVEGVYVQI